MAENIIMPQLGESIAEGTIVKWLKEIGDSVKKDENIVLISTDKVEAEIPSPKAGVLIDIAVGPGETVAVGTVLGQVGEKGEEGQQKKKAEEPKSKESQAAPAKEKEGRAADKKEDKKDKPDQGRAIKSEQDIDARDMSSFISPLVRRIAQEHGIKESEILNIEGSGRGGRVSKKDLLEYLDSRGSNEEGGARESMDQAQGQVESGVREERKPISTMRRVIMENMVASKTISAHVTTFFEIDFTAIDKVRAEHKRRFQEEEQVPLTYTTFLAAAVCQTLKRHPYINASINKDSIIFKKDIHLGIAVAIENPEPGLMVPVIKHADMQNLRGLAHAIADISARVRSRKIKPDELSGGTFTITNPGNYGAVIGTPIINQPQVAILGVGQIKKQPCVMEMDGTDVIAIRRMGILSLSFDHRLIDGATADIFMADLKHALETFSTAP